MDQDGDCLLLNGSSTVAEASQCVCNGCTSERSQTPAVVISRGKPQPSSPSSSSSGTFSLSGKDKDSINHHHDVIDLEDHNITFRNVKEFVDGGILETVGGADQSSLLIYAQRQGRHRQVGICAALAVEDCLKGVIKRHEKVTKDAAALAKAAVEQNNLRASQTGRQHSNSNCGSSSNSGRSNGSGSGRGTTAGSSSSVNGSSHHHQRTARNVDPVMMMYRHNDAVQRVVDRIMATTEPIMRRTTPTQSINLSAPSSRRGTYMSDSESDSSDDEDNGNNNHNHIRHHDGGDGYVSGGEESASLSTPTISCLHVDDDGGVVCDGPGPTVPMVCPYNPYLDQHEVWSITDEADVAALTACFEEGIDSLYIADGHHRTAAACRMLRHPEELGNKAPKHTKFLMGFLFPHTHMNVLPYNRCVTTLGDKSPEQFLQMLSERFEITERVDLTGSARNLTGSAGALTGSAGNLTGAVRPSPGFCASPDPGVLSVLSRCIESCGVSGVSREGDRVSVSDTDRVRGRGSYFSEGLSYAVVVGDDSSSSSVASSSSSSSSSSSLAPIVNRPAAQGQGQGQGQGGEGHSNSNNGNPEGEAVTGSCGISSHNTSHPSSHTPSQTTSHSCSSDLLRLEAPRLDRLRDPSPLVEHHLSMYFQGRWLDLRPLEAVCEREGDPVSSLDVQVLFERLLRPVLGIECPRTDHRMIYVCGSEGAAGLEHQVHSGAASVAFCVSRVAVADIMRVADAGQLMPPKATCFNPKPLSGLLTRLC